MVRLSGPTVNFQPSKTTRCSAPRKAKLRSYSTPGVFLRLAENSSVRMVSSKLTDTRVEVLTGSALVEVDDLPKDDSIMLLSKGSTILLVKHGLYRVDADAGVFKVYDGEALVKAESEQLTLRKGKETVLSGALVAQNFDPKDDDELYRWSDRRSGYLAKANVSSASGLSSSYGGYGGYGNYGLGGRSGWLYNSMFGMYTYVPYDGFLFSPFGYGFYSPYSVWQAPYYYYGGGGGGGVGGGRGIAGVSHSGSSTGRHAPFMPARGSSGSSGAGYASRGGAASYGGGSAGVGAARSGGSSVDSAAVAQVPARHMQQPL